MYALFDTLAAIDLFSLPTDIADTQVGAPSSPGRRADRYVGTTLPSVDEHARENQCCTGSAKVRGLLLHSCLEMGSLALLTHAFVGPMLLSYNVPRARGWETIYVAG